MNFTVCTVLGAWFRTAECLLMTVQLVSRALLSHRASPHSFLRPTYPDFCLSETCFFIFFKNSNHLVCDYPRTRNINVSDSVHMSLPFLIKKIANLCKRGLQKNPREMCTLHLLTLSDANFLFDPKAFSPACQWGPPLHAEERLPPGGGPRRRAVEKPTANPSPVRIPRVWIFLLKKLRRWAGSSVQLRAPSVASQKAVWLFFFVLSVYTITTTFLDSNIFLNSLWLAGGFFKK